MKKLFEAVHRPARGKGLVITLVVLGATGGTAVAATINGGNGDVTVIGTPNVADTINVGGGDDIIYGLGGGDTINVGGGNDQIDADGHCSGGYDTVTPRSASSSYYCSHGQIPGEGNSTINVNGGQGSDVIFGGGGHNTINANNPGGNNTIYGGPLGDTINMATSGMSDNKIYLGGGRSYTGSTVNDGNGGSVIHAQNGVKDTITCQRGNGTTVYADRVDVVHGCARVIYTADPNPGPMPRPVRDASTVRHTKHTKSVHRKTKKHGRRH